MSRQEANDTRLAHSRLSGECRLKALLRSNVVHPGGAGPVGRKRGIFVLVVDEIAKDNRAMNTLIRA